MFSKFGEIESAIVKAGPNGELMDSGFVNFKNSEDATKAIDALNKSKMPNGSILIVSEHISKQQNQLSQGQDKLTSIDIAMKKTFDSNIYAQFVPLNVTEAQLREVFSKAGDIVSVKLSKGQSLSYQNAYVLFDNVDQAKRAIQLFHESIDFGGKPLKVDFWLSKQEREQEKKQRDLNEMKWMFDLLQR